MGNVPSGIGALGPGGYGLPAGLGNLGRTNVSALAPLAFNSVVGGPVPNSQIVTAPVSSAPFSISAPVAHSLGNGSPLGSFLNLVKIGSGAVAPGAANGLYMPGAGAGGNPVRSAPLPRSGGKGAIG
jgi:hypothetical protein